MNHEGSRKHEAHEVFSTSFRMRHRSPLGPQADRVMTHTIGCAIAVHRALGPGFLESIYRRAMCVDQLPRPAACKRPQTDRALASRASCSSHSDLRGEGQRTMSRCRFDSLPFLFHFIQRRLAEDPAAR